MTKWEYKEVKGAICGNEEICNQLGQQGWELVSSYFNQGGSHSILLFKRPKQEY